MVMTNIGYALCRCLLMRGKYVLYDKSHIEEEGAQH